ncbi:MAG: response regulator [Deltaproteobacteria bacterium]|nr:response regulator [Deltaproteobacteria bacterium]
MVEQKIGTSLAAEGRMSDGPRPATESLRPQFECEPIEDSASRDLPILLVEDDDLDAYLFDQFLDLSGVRVTVVRATSLGEARAMLRESQFLVIFVDLNLSDAHGPDIVRVLREDSRGGWVIALTGSIDPRVHRRCVELGATEAATKETLGPAWLEARLTRARREAVSGPAR